MINVPPTSTDQYQTAVEKLGTLLDGPIIKEILRTHMKWMRDTETWNLNELSGTYEIQKLFKPYLTRATVEIAQEVISSDLRKEGGIPTDEARALNQAVLDSREKSDAVFLEIFDSVFLGCMKPEVMATVREELAFEFYKYVIFGVGDSLPADAKADEGLASLMDSIERQAGEVTGDMI